MFQRRTRRFRRRPNGRYRSSRGDDLQSRMRTNSFPNDQPRNNFRINPHNAEKLFEKYNNLAKEAISSGDKTLGENYLQHADHFMRIIEDKNRNQNRVQVLDKTASDNKPSAENTVNNKDITNEKEKFLDLNSKQNLSSHFLS